MRYRKLSGEFTDRADWHNHQHKPRVYQKERRDNDVNRAAHVKIGDERTEVEKAAIRRKLELLQRKYLAMLAERKEERARKKVSKKQVESTIDTEAWQHQNHEHNEMLEGLTQEEWEKKRRYNLSHLEPM
jgi:hypothetical protein